MAEPIVSFLLESISKLLVDEAKFLLGVKDAATKLHSELKTMQAFLKDADAKQNKNNLVRELVSQCRDLAYEAENILEDYTFKLASRRGKKDTFSFIKYCACIIPTQRNVGAEIRSVITKISDLTGRFQKYEIVRVTEGDGSNSSQQLQQLRMTYSYVATDEDFVGFGNDVEKLVNGFGNDVEKLVKALVNEDNTCGVVSICGMGGCGKTTLARKVYNHPNMKRHFVSFAWICISQQWQTRNILQGVLVSFLPDNDKRRNEIEKWRDDEIVEQLVQIQQNQKCFVVLDDIWSINAWDCIKFAFPIRKKGSKILITTRNKDVAMHIGPNGYYHEQRLLTDAESLELLMKKAIRGQPNQVDIQNLQELGEEMVKSCRGLPLAVVVLGGILVTKPSTNEWEEVYKNIKSYLGKGERMEQNEGEVQRILALSYSDLPYKLKPCFLYLSMFPEDARIEACSLYALWIAEGMVFREDRMGDESMIEMADRYLGELAKRCLVTVKESGVYTTHGRYAYCHLHDLLRDLCKAKAKEEKFLEFLDYGRGNQIELANSVSSSTGSYVPRIMISLSEQDAALHSPIQLQQGSEHLRTLVFSATKRTGLVDAQIWAKSQMNRFKRLRSLVLENVIFGREIGVKMCGYELPVGKLIHLRLLRLRKSVFMMSPSSISNLEHLEILDLGGSHITWSENVPIKTRRLRYLDLSVAKSNFCMEIYIVDPNHLEVIYGLPSHLFCVRNLSDLTNVRDLGGIDISSDQVNAAQEIFKCISKSHHLKHAYIRADNEVLRHEGETALLAQLFRSNVENIFLGGAVEKLPEYDSQFLINLLSLRLFSCRIEDDPMKILEKLPKLQRLEFFDMAFVGKEIVCHSWGFSQLRFLTFNNLPTFETWTVGKGTMPSLSHLEIIRCRQLRTIPDELGFLTALKELVFQYMSQEFYERNIHNFRHVPSIVVNGSKHVFP